MIQLKSLSPLFKFDARQQRLMLLKKMRHVAYPRARIYLYKTSLAYSATYWGIFVHSKIKT